MKDIEAVKRTEETYRRLKAHRQKTHDKIVAKAERYYFGDQWSDEDKRIYDLKRRSVPVYNEILANFNAILGFYLQSRGDLAAKPVDEHGDVILASIITSLMKNIDWQNHIFPEEQAQFQDGGIARRGIIEIWLEQNSDFDLDIKMAQSAQGHWYLGEHEKYDMRDMTDAIKETYYTLDQIENIFGKKIAKKLIPKESDENAIPTTHVRPTWDSNSTDYGNRDNKSGSELLGSEINIKSKYRVLEHYRQTYENKQMYLHPETNVVGYVDDLGDDEAEMVKPYSYPNKESVILLTTTIDENTVVFKDKDTEASEFYHLINKYSPFFHNGREMGIVETMMSAQDHFNKWISSITEIVTKHAQSGERYEDGAYPVEVEQQLDDLIASGAAIKMNEGKLNARKTDEPTPVPDIYPQMLTFNQSAMQRQVNATDALLGIEKRRSSGTAKTIGYQQSAGALSGIVENMITTKVLRGLAMLHWIQKKYTTERIFRIIGNDGMTKQEVTINQNLGGKIHNDVTIGKYDITMEIEGRTQSARERNELMISQEIQHLPPNSPYLPIWLKYRTMLSDIPQKEKMFQEVEQMQQAQQQMQQQQMAAQTQPGNTPTPQG
ncbi:MAG: hypothetical protein ABIH23_03325 [bacterium]